MDALVHMSARPSETTRNVAMSWENYLALGDGVRGEYVDGRLHVIPRPTPRHQRAAHRLVRLLETAGLPAHQEIAWQHGANEWHPDVLVAEGVDLDAPRFEGVPRLLVDVLSSNAADHLIRKRRHDADAGVPAYWILDPGERVLWALELREDNRYDEVAEIADVGRVPGFDVEIVIDDLLG